VAAESTSPVIIPNDDQGTVSISYLVNSDKIYRVLVTKEDKKVSYYLRTDGVSVNFPLSYGNGEYEVSVLVNVSGNNYKKIKTENVNVSLEDEKAVYLNSVQNINWNDNLDAVKKAKELTKGLDTDEEKIKAVYGYIVNNFEYDYGKLSKLKNDYLPDIDSTFNTQNGICYDFSSTFAAMLRSIDIPTKLVKGYADDVDGYHAWNEVYNSTTGKWMTIDTTYDAQMRAYGRKFTMEKDTGKYDTVNVY
jgi:transglutaminase-like putative cysteine protease